MKAMLVIVVEPPASPSPGRAGDRARTVVATADVPPSDTGRAKPAVVRGKGGDGNAPLERFNRALRAGRRVGRGSPGAVLGPGDTVVLQLPNARRDTDPTEPRPALAVGRSPARVVALDNGGKVVADTVVDDRWSPPRGVERLVVVGLGLADERPISAIGLLGWHAGSRLPYVGRSSAVGPGCVVRTRGATIAGHRERGEAGWITGAELARGVTTGTTRFNRAVRSIATASSCSA